VRVATALVVGQVALCAVIGWMTFGVSHNDKSDKPHLVGPLAGGPLMIPTPVVPLPQSPGPSSTGHAGPAHVFRTLAAPTLPPIRPSAVLLSAVPSAPTGSAVPPKPPAGDLLPATTAPTKGNPGKLDPSPEVQALVKLLDVCDPAGAAGLTVDGTSVQCLRTSDGTLAWQIN
jgi:hypothetical protein